jgi:peptide chain release factor 2|tara:strand:+ start:860 stop:1729 length:870 start_codon:yes stop_codon:yes gene_type:complete
VSDARELLGMAVEENDADTVADVEAEMAALETQLAKLEFRRMFSGAMDENSAFLEIQSGSGGTEAQDWAEMLLRMYLRWADDKGFKAELLECSAGDVAGIKSATVEVTGEYAFGWLRTEIGVHRLVRKSPFDSGNRRHTSFAAVFISPEIDDNIEIDIDPSDVRTDTYRASGAGGQHINKTDSAVRLTHAPTGVVVQSQSQRSQHQNRDKCWQMLRARLYELEVSKRQEAAQATEDTKSDIGWGSQIRSYVLDDARIKDLRTNIETRNTQAVLDGKLDQFIVASLKAGL